MLGGRCSPLGSLGRSPPAPLGPAGRGRPDPRPRLSTGTVLGPDSPSWSVGLSVLTVVLAYRRAASTTPGRTGRTSRTPVERRERGCAEPGLPLLRWPACVSRSNGGTAVDRGARSLGSRSAPCCRDGRGRDDHLRQRPRAPLSSHPALYGWNWELRHRFPERKRGPSIARHLLTRDPTVAAWTGFNFADRADQRRTVPAFVRGGKRSRTADLVRPWHRGGEPDRGGGRNARRLAQKARRHRWRSATGPAKTLRGPYVRPAPMVVVGTATMPAIGSSGSLHPSMGTGA